MGLFDTPGTKRYMIAELEAMGLTAKEAYSELRPKVAGQVRPWVFTTNSPQGRQAKPLSDQFVELQHEINRVYALISRVGNELKDKPKDRPVDPKPEPKEEELPQAKGKTSGPEAEKRLFVSEWKRIRRFLHDTEERTKAVPLDSLDSMRPIQAARVMIEQGISAKTLLHAMTLHWPEASRTMAGIETVDFLTESEDLGTGFHRMAGYVLKVATAITQAPVNQRFGIMLVGPSGTGKSRLLKQVASLVKTESWPDGIPYGETPMTPGATRGDLLGRHTANTDHPFISSQCMEIYAGGGLFNLEELDASDPGMIIVINNALSSGEFYNSANGEIYQMHPDCIFAATANTFGMGADSKYTGREKLDLATIDRFRMGRVLLSLDETLAESLMFGDR